jgi:hypothetical protein
MSPCPQDEKKRKSYLIEKKNRFADYQKLSNHSMSPCPQDSKKKENLQPTKKKKLFVDY